MTNTKIATSYDVYNRLRLLGLDLDRLVESKYSVVKFQIVLTAQQPAIVLRECVDKSGRMSVYKHIFKLRGEPDAEISSLFVYKLLKNSLNLPDGATSATITLETDKIAVVDVSYGISEESLDPLLGLCIE